MSPRTLGRPGVETYPFREYAAFSSEMTNASSDCGIYLDTILPKLYGYQLSENPKCCDDSGTVCANNRIEKILLPAYKLGGFLPQEMSQLNALIQLDLSRNQLSGPIPTEYGQLKRLQYFYLDFNKLSGSIPNEVGDMVALRDLKLNNNSFTGTVPDSIRNLNNLTQL